MKSVDRKLTVFLCHASQDKPIVRDLYQRLSLEGWIDPWLDEEKLLPGQKWDIEIKKAVEAANVVIVCFSSTSVSKEGYVQRELRFSLNIALEKPEETIFIIPLRLDECKPPSSLDGLHYANYFPPERRDSAYGRLLQSLELRAAETGVAPLKETPPPVAISRETEPSVPQQPTHQPAATPQERLTLSNGMEFCRIPAGKFLMGSAANDKDTYKNEKPQHEVNIRYDYWMARFPITNAQYIQYDIAANVKHGMDDWPNQNDHPVMNVNWKDAQAYCQWLTDMLKAQLPSNYVLRLPTEAEWEKAARGVSGNLYPWGNTFDPGKCNTRESGMANTTPVGLYSPQGDSPYGCADMSGNVFEWTSSLFKPYPYNAQDGRDIVKTSGSRVARGGAFDLDAPFAHCTYRYDSMFYRFIWLVGFRVVAAPSLSELCFDC